MKYFGEGLSEKHRELAKIIRKKDELLQAKLLFLDIHASLHLSDTEVPIPNEVDTLIRDIKENEYAIMPKPKDETIAWVIWHIARIEDLTMNMLVAGRNQLFNEEWKSRMNVSITDTGNALTDDEIMYLSHSINIKELLRYWNAVSKSTKEIIHMLHDDDMKQKVSEVDLKRILDIGGVTEQKDSIWLLDFWGKKDVAGILLMPPTRHVILHLNDCCKWKEHIRSGKKIYRC